MDSSKETSIKDDSVPEGGESSSTTSGMWSVIEGCGYVLSAHAPFHFRHEESKGSSSIEKTWTTQGSRKDCDWFAKVQKVQRRPNKKASCISEENNCEPR